MNAIAVVTLQKVFKDGFRVAVLFWSARTWQSHNAKLDSGYQAYQ
jgi:hypothetical protein